jgi:hypothetical protein
LLGQESPESFRGFYFALPGFSTKPARIKAAFASIPHIASKQNDENRMTNDESMTKLECRNDLHVPEHFRLQVAADRRNVGVHARTNVAIQPRFTIFGAKDNMNDDLANPHFSLAQRNVSEGQLLLQK